METIGIIGVIYCCKVCGLDFCGWSLGQFRDWVRWQVQSAFADLPLGLRRRQDGLNVGFLLGFRV